MQHDNETQNTWNKVAEVYNEKFMPMNFYNETYDFLCDNIQKQSAKIMDVACGPGNITKYLLDKRPDFKIKGIDYAPNMIDWARKNNPNADFEILDFKNISVLPDKFDAIICGFGLPYMNKQEVIQFLNDCKNLMNSKGLLYLSFVAGDAEESGYKTGSSGDRVFFHYHDKRKLIEELSKASFKLLKTFEVDYPIENNDFEIHDILIGVKI